MMPSAAQMWDRSPRRRPQWMAVRSGRRPPAGAHRALESWDSRSCAPGGRLTAEGCGRATARRDAASAWVSAAESRHGCILGHLPFTVWMAHPSSSTYHKRSMPPCRSPAKGVVSSGAMRPRQSSLVTAHQAHSRSLGTSLAGSEATTCPHHHSEAVPELRRYVVGAQVHGSTARV